MGGRTTAICLPPAMPYPHPHLPGTAVIRVRPTLHRAVAWDSWEPTHTLLTTVTSTGSQLPWTCGLDQPESHGWWLRPQSHSQPYWWRAMWWDPCTGKALSWGRGQLSRKGLSLCSALRWVGRGGAFGRMRGGNRAACRRPTLCTYLILRVLGVSSLQVRKLRHGLSSCPKLSGETRAKSGFEPRPSGSRARAFVLL